MLRKLINSPDQRWQGWIYAKASYQIIEEEILKMVLLKVFSRKCCSPLTGTKEIGKLNIKAINLTLNICNFSAISNRVWSIKNKISSLA